MEAKQRKLETYRSLFGAFLTTIPSDALFEKYFNSYEEGEKYDNDGFEDMQEFTVNHLKPEFSWSTGIGIIEGIEHVVEEAFSNANIEVDTWESQYFTTK